jgi:DNA-binding GntR family transcriptional regulator
MHQFIAFDIYSQVGKTDHRTRAERMSQQFLTKTDFVANTIRQWLLQGVIRPGTRLTQRELSEKLDMSITPVREALRQLESEGIVTYNRHQGVRVAEIDCGDLEQVGSIRAVVEEHMLSMVFPSITEEHIERLKKLQVDVEEAVNRGDWTAARRLNRDFHLAIYECGASRTATEILEYVWNKFQWQVLPAKRMNESIREHWELLGHLESGNLEKAKAAIHKHVLEWTVNVMSLVGQEKG